MDISEAFPSNYLQATDLKNRNITLTIARYDREEIGRERRIKPVIYFQKARKGWVLALNANPTGPNPFVGTLVLRGAAAKDKEIKSITSRTEGSGGNTISFWA